jgi:hypothetical protein
MADDFFLTVTPWRLTSSGSCGMARETRFWTLTVLMSGSVPTAKLTVSV